MWMRYRFYTSETDERPIKFPPPGPWWCTGTTGEGNAIIVAYLPAGVVLREYWPEAWEVDIEPKDEIEYSDRFPKPAWFK